LIPSIWIREDAGAGAFPVGTWIHSNGGYYEEKLIFTAAKLTVDSSSFDTVEYSYTVSGDTFVCSYIATIPCAATPQEQAEINAFNEAAYRASHPWVPGTSTISPTATKNGVLYMIKDNPNMTFIGDPAVIGVWTSIDLKINNSTDPNDKWTRNLMKWANGPNEVSAPVYDIRTIGGTAYLFVEDKNDDYSRHSRKPFWLVFKKM
jgi:hypothetical protein